MPQEIIVRNVTGRYPHGPAAFRGENIVASVSEIARVYRIRLDDSENLDAWMELTVEISGDEIIMGEPLDERELGDMPLYADEEIPF